MTRRKWQHLALINGLDAIEVRVRAETPAEGARVLNCFLDNHVMVGSADTIWRDHRIALQDDITQATRALNEAMERLEILNAAIKDVIE